MRRFLMSVLLTIMCSFFAFAGGVKYLSGNKKLFKTAEGGMLLEISFEGATYDYSSPLEERWPDIDHYALKARDGFIQDFRENFKKVYITENKSEAKYSISIKIDNVDMYAKVMSWVPGPAIKVWGILVITDTASGEELLRLSLKELCGGASPSQHEAMSDTFELLADELKKFK